VADGGGALDLKVVTQLLGASRRNDGLGTLTARQRDVLAIMAEGRSNAAIAGISSAGIPRSGRRRAAGM
jgi:DNA-binding NarL/FixJ family response regulator